MGKPVIMQRACLLTLIVVTFIAYFHREFIFGETYFDTDQLFSFLPHVYEVFRSANPEAAFLWTNKILFGYSYAESVLVPYWHFPENLLYRILPLVPATNLAYAFHFGSALVFMFLSSRRLGIGIEGSLFSALVFTFSGIVTSNICHFNDVTIVLSLPLLFWLLDHTLEKPRSFWPLLFALALGNTLAYGHSQFAFYNCLALALYFLLRNREISSSKQTARWGAFLLGVIFAIGIASPHLFVLVHRLLELGSDGARAVPEALDNTRNPLSLLFNFLAPFALAGDLPQHSDPKVFSVNSCLVAVYFGVVPFLLGLLGLGHGREHLSRATFRFLCALLCFGVIVFLLPLHWNGWSLLHLVDHVPILNIFHFHSRAIFLMIFAAAIFAGHGFELASQSNTKIPKPLWITVFGVLLLTITATVFQSDALTPLKPGIWATADAWTDGEFSHQLALGSPLSIVVLSILALAWLRSREIIKAPHFGFILALISALELLHFGLAYKPTIRADSVFDPPTLANYLANGHDRLASYVEDYFYYDRRLLTVDRRRALAFNTNLFYGIEESGGFVTPSHSAEFYPFFRQLNLRVPYQADGWYRIPSVHPGDFVRLLQMSSISHVITEQKIESADFSFIGRDENLLLYAVRNPLPKIYSVLGVQRFTDRRDLVQAFPSLKNPQDLAMAIDPSGELEERYERAQIGELYRSENKLNFEVRAERQGFLVINDAYHPNWRAWAGDKPLKIFQTNGIFRGIEIPAGSYQVRLEYQNPAFALGKIVRGISLVMLVLAIGAICLLERKRLIQR